MARLTLTLETVTPLLMNGAQQTPEVRAASFRGVLRYWLRAVLGGVYQGDIDMLKEAESRYFGNTEAGSPLRVRVMRHNLEPDNAREKFVLPPSVRTQAGGVGPYQHRGFHRRNDDEPEQIVLVMDTHPLQRASSVFTLQMYSALLLTFRLGALGKRSRRGGGVLRIVDVSASWDDTLFQQFNRLATALPETSVKLQEFLKDELIPFVTNAQSLLGYTPVNFYSPDYLPEYSVWMPEHVKVLVKRQGFKDDPHVQPLLHIPDPHRNRFHEGYRHALQDLWDISGALNLHHTQGAWGYAGHDGRRASAVHMHVQMNNQTPVAFYPMVTMLQSGYDDEDWDQLENLDSQLQSPANNYVRVFGTGVWS